MHARALLVILLVGCGARAEGPPIERSPGAERTGGDDPGAPSVHVASAEELARPSRCGPFDAGALGPEGSLLEGRMVLPFFAGAAWHGDERAGRLAVERDGAELFVAGVEPGQRAGDDFDARAAERLGAGGLANVARVEGADRRVWIGLPLLPERDALVELARGHAARADGDVIDVRILASRHAVTDLAGCQALALRILSGMRSGPRAIAHGALAAAEARLDDVTLRAELGTAWRVLQAVSGARPYVRYERQAVFPERPLLVQVAILGPDEHTSDEAAAGTRPGRVLGHEVTWRLFASEHGRHAVSELELGADHVTADVVTPTAAELDEGIAFAERVTVDR